MLRDGLGSLHRRRGGGEREEERIALGVDLDPVLPGARLAHDASVFCERRCVRLGAELVEQLRRASTSVKRNVTVPEEIRAHGEIMRRRAPRGNGATPRRSTVGLHASPNGRIEDAALGDVKAANRARSKISAT